MFTPLEKAVIEALLEKRDEPFGTIRQQLAHSTIAKREFTGVGFFVEFTLPAEAPIARGLPDLTVGDVSAQFAGLRHGADFLLFVRGGVVSMLEGYTYDERWPANTDEFRVYRRCAA